MRALLCLSLMLGCGSASERAEPRAATANDPCPVLSDPANQDVGGLVPSLAGDDVPTDLDGLAASLPAVAEGSTIAKIPRGYAGHWSPEVAAAYERDGVTWRVSITDLVHVCTCTEGMGETLRRGVTNAEDRMLGAVPARVRPGEVLVWIHDRCALQVGGQGPTEVAWALAQEIDLDALARACPAR
ncbi:MAG: hypothetical protein H6722_32735 [Sandaracinus sp.]|nr:hypothetical protein [Myxococcales bacterium]MCB9617223.1 hypothetical protein [Sandaracinus sp.]MCB9618472.1 hypothetical protein [Sandaracinus sp.]